MGDFVRRNILYFAWVISLFSMLGSLYFSEIMHFAPCILCWYQRILMYPLVLIIAVGIINKDRKISSYVLPFSLIGSVIALYHSLFYYNILPESTAPCTFGVSCTTKFIELFGFASIPLLSLIAFLVISICMILYNMWYTKKI